jgi:uncharacterized membrane protein HdeD (DUF308 family)
MRMGRALAGAALIVLGAVWTLQGYGTVTGSFMTGSPVWMWIGIACVIAGVILVVTARSSRRQRSAGSSDQRPLE